MVQMNGLAHRERSQWFALGGWLDSRGAAAQRAWGLAVNYHTSLMQSMAM
jgi:hypothetical protein